MRSGTVWWLAVSLLGTLVVATVQAQTRRTVKPPLHGRHWMAITGKPLAATAGALIVRAGRQRGRRGLRDARRDLHDVGHARLGRRDAGPGLRPADEKVIGVNALGVAPTGATPEFFRAQRTALPARVRPARGGDPGHAGRPAHDARRVRAAAAWGRARAGDRDGRRLPDRGPAREHDRAAEDDARAVAVLARGVLPPPRRGARGAGRGRDVPPARPRAHAAQARRGRAAGPRRRARAARRRSWRRTTASTAATSPTSSCAATREQGGALHEGGPRRAGR